MNAHTQTLTPSLNARHSSEGWNPVAQPHSREAGMTFSQAANNRPALGIPATPPWIAAFAGMTAGANSVMMAHTDNGTL